MWMWKCIAQWALCTLQTSAWGKIQTLFLYPDQKELSFGFSNRKLTKRFVLRFQGWIKEHRFACFPLLHEQGDRYIYVSSEEEALSTVLV